MALIWESQDGHLVVSDKTWTAVKILQKMIHHSKDKMTMILNTGSENI